MEEACWAALDIGSNTVMTLAAQGVPGRLREDEEWRATTRLGQGVDSSGMLAPEAQERTLAAIAAQTTACRRRYPSGSGVAVATSAARDAGNGPEFLARSAALVGGVPRLLSGEEEARFTFRGIVSDLPRGRAVVHLDVGGGSSEITAGIAGEGCLAAESVNLGCVRLGERFGLLDTAAPDAIAAARETIQALLQPVCQRLQTLPGVAGAGVILSGGSATTYAALQLALPAYDASRVHAWPGQTADLAALLPRLFAMTAVDRAALPSVSAGRAPVLPAGLLILCEFLHLCDASQFRVSTRGLRFGLVSALAAGEVAPTWRW
jgi:exopolyphosphatase/guanosine-5'-triphosphate,3'-diphosphate pyrophosphatase